MLHRKHFFLWSIFIFAIVFWGFILIFLVSSLAPYNTTSLNFLSKRATSTLREFLPEGFGYFTRNPMEEFPLVYRLEGDSLILLTRSNSSPSNLFGILRTQRSTFGEMGMIMQEISEETWTKCGSSLVDCVKNKKYIVVELSNNKINANVCGTFFVCTKKPIPWAWRKSFKGEMPLRFVEIVVNCEDGLH